MFSFTRKPPVSGQVSACPAPPHPHLSVFPLRACRHPSWLPWQRGTLKRNSGVTAAAPVCAFQAELYLLSQHWKQRRRQSGRAGPGTPEVTPARSLPVQGIVVLVRLMLMVPLPR